MRHAIAFGLALALAACSAPTPPADEPLDPQAAAAAAGASDLREAIEAPLDKAHGVEAAQAAENAERDAALEDAGT